MNFSAELISYKIAVFREMREFHTSEIARIDKLLQQWEWEDVENHEGEVIPFANYSSAEDEGHDSKHF